MYEQENETQQEDERIIPSHALRESRSLTNFHDVDDEDDLSTGKEKSAQTSLRKTNNSEEDEQQRWIGQSRSRSPKT